MPQSNISVALEPLMVDFATRLSGLVESYEVGFTEFKSRVWPMYQRAHHLDMLDENLEQVSRYVETKGREGIQMLMVEMPPRHGKSLTLSRLFPIWFLGRNPNKHVILVSHTASLAYQHSRFSRNLIRGERYRSMFSSRIAQDSRSVSVWHWEKPYEGGFDAIGMGGAIIGRGADLLVIDDPVKGREEVESEDQRDKIWDIYLNDLVTRLEPNAAIILLSQRWHTDDIMARLIQTLKPDDFTRLHFPALATKDNDPLGREIGEPLWPERFNKDYLDDLRLLLGEYVWQSMYQQNPILLEGGLWQEAWISKNRVQSDYLHQGRVYPDQIVVAVDPAVTSGSQANETGIVVCAKGNDGRGYVLADRSFRGTPHQWANRVVETYHEFECDRVVVEVNNGGEMVEHTLRNLSQNLPIRSVRATRGKITRAEPISALYERGLVSHCGHFSELEAQLLTYTGNSSYTSPDRMDALCWGFHYLFPTKKRKPFIPGLERKRTLPRRPTISRE